MNHHLTLSCLLIFVLLSASVKATIINVPADYATIQEGIDAAQPGDTVLVQAGTYLESLVVKADIFLLGSGFETTYIDGEGEGNEILGDVITLDGPNCTVEGFTIENSGFSILGCGINMTHSNCVARNNRIRNCRIGVRVHGNETGSCVVERNLIYDNPGLCGLGFGQPPTDIPIYPKAINNTIYNSIRGIQFSNSVQPVIINNIIKNNWDIGIASFDSDTTVIKFNNVISNGVNYFQIDDQTGTNGNISKNPSFVSESLDNFHLQENSPCIDAGDTLSMLDPDLTRADMGVFYFHQTASGISEKEEPFKSLMIYPNPTTGLINFSNDQLQIGNNVRYTIHNSLGQLVKSGELVNSTLDLYSFQPGIYVLSTYSGGKIYYAKVMKQ